MTAPSSGISACLVSLFGTDGSTILFLTIDRCCLLPPLPAPSSEGRLLIGARFVLWFT